MDEATLEELIEHERRLYKRTLKERYGDLPEEYLCRRCHQPERLIQLTPIIGYYVHKCSWIDENLPKLAGNYAFRKICGFGDYDAETGGMKMDVREKIE